MGARSSSIDPQRVEPRLSIDNLVAELVKAKEAHLRDLRVLLDQASDREAKLVEALAAKSQPRTAPAQGSRAQAIAPAVPIEVLGDPEFSSEADADRRKEEAERQRELQQQFEALSREEHEAELAKT